MLILIPTSRNPINARTGAGLLCWLNCHFLFFIELCVCFFCFFFTRNISFLRSELVFFCCCCLWTRNIPFFQLIDLITVPISRDPFRPEGSEGSGDDNSTIRSLSRSQGRFGCSEWIQEPGDAIENAGNELSRSVPKNLARCKRCHSYNTESSSLNCLSKYDDFSKRMTSIITSL